MGAGEQGKRLKGKGKRNKLIGIAELKYEI